MPLPRTIQRSLNSPRLPVRVPAAALLRLAAVVAAATSIAGFSSAADMASAARESLSAGDARRHVTTLADDTLEGRRAGSRGGRAASAYLAEQLERIGTAPAGESGSFFQPFRGMRNVIAIVRGRDPELSREAVLVGAHYDHVGYGTPSNSYGPTGYIHNGADDNASGVAGLLEIAEAISLLPTRPRRTIVLAFWDGEEIDLLGSRHFITNRPPPLAHHTIVFSVNLDMIGRLRDRTLEVFGSRTAVGLRRCVTAANRTDELALAFTWELSDDSDHYPFIAAGIPTLMFHTGLHPEYHRPSDDAHLVNYEGIPPVTRVALETVLAVADDSGPAPVFRPECRRESESGRRRLESPAPPAVPKRWGLGTREDPGDPTAPIVVRVSPQTPTALAGVAVGDRIVAIDGKPLVDQEAMIRRLSEAGPEVTLTLERRGVLREIRCLAKTQ
jgi:hypothetical protein